MNNKAVGYVRVSTDRQVREGQSLPAQRERITAYCIAHGLDLVQIFEDEGVSGSIPLAMRAGGSAMLQQLGTTAMHFVATKSDRPFRNLLDAMMQMADFNATGITTHLLDFGGMSLNTGSAMGKFFFHMRMAQAEMERDLARERTFETITYKRTKGERIGQVPFGYCAVGGKLVSGKLVGSQLVELPGRTAAIAEILDLRQAKFSYRAIAHYVNENYGKEYHVSHNTIKRLLSQTPTNKEAVA